MKIGLVAFGSSIRGIASEEESSANAAIIEAPALKILIELGATLYIVGPLQRRTREIITDENHPYHRPYMKHIIICDNTADEPKDLDILWCQSGSDNLRLTGLYNKHNMPCAAHMYRVFAKYPNAPIIYYQTDVAAPCWYTGELYDLIYKKLFDIALFKNRNIHIFVAGSKGKEVYQSHQWAYTLENICKIHFFPPDLHFLIDLDDLKYSYDYPKSITAIAFAGKERISGSRGTTINKYLEADHLPFELAGKWTEETIANFKAKNNNFTFLGKLPEYRDVTNLYNSAGSTLYMSSKDYTAIGTITSRMYDAIHAKAIPFVNEADYPLVVSQFGEFPELSVTPSTLKDRIKYFNGHPHERMKTLDRLKGSYLETRQGVALKFAEVVLSIAKEKVERSALSLDGFLQLGYRHMLNSLRRNRPKSDEELEDRVVKFFKYKELTLDEICDSHPLAAKTQLGFNEKYKNRVEFDLPRDLYQARIDFITNNY